MQFDMPKTLKEETLFAVRIIFPRASKREGT